MKKRYIWMLTCLSAFLTVSCEINEIEVFGTEHEVQFEKFFMNELYPGTSQADSTMVTFYFANQTQKYSIANLTMHLSGRGLTEDLHFKLRVVPEGTTALPDEYELDEYYTFRAKPLDSDPNVILDTIQIKMRRSNRLSEHPEGVRLMVEIVPNAQVGAGQYERSRAIIILTENAVRPSWWTKEVEVFLFGTYSSKKYGVFLRYVENAENLDESMIKNKPDQAIKLARAFKKWIAEQDSSNPDIYEEDGSLMTVNV